MSSIRTVSIDYGDTRFSIYLISLPGKYQTPDAATTHVMHSHFYYELHYASRGQCLYRFSDREVLLQEGQMLLIPPGQHHLSVGKDSERHHSIAIGLIIALLLFNQIHVTYRKWYCSLFGFTSYLTVGAFQMSVLGLDDAFHIVEPMLDGTPLTVWFVAPIYMLGYAIVLCIIELVRKQFRVKKG